MLNTAPDIYFNHLEGNSRCFCQDVAETGVFLTPPIFPDTPALFLMTVGAVGGQRAVDVISIIFPPTGRIPPPVSQEIQHFENIKVIDCSTPAFFPRGTEELAPDPPTSSNGASLQFFDSLPLATALLPCVLS